METKRFVKNIRYFPMLFIILFVLIVSSIPIGSMAMWTWGGEGGGGEDYYPPPLNSGEPAPEITPGYPNSDIASLWVRKNGSDGGFPFSGANVAPSYGMNYFGTNVIQIGWDYNLTEISTIGLFPDDSEIYIQITDDWTQASYASTIATLALTDHRIKGVWIDDFPVNYHATWEMATIYNAVHSQDNVGYTHTLTLGVVIYQYTYFKNPSGDGWGANAPYVDIIHFWFYPRSYQLLYREFAGFLDDFNSMRELIPNKEYWIGIYLHYYNNDHYPHIYSTNQINIAMKLIKEGKATRVSILENFWIQHNTDTAVIIKNALSEHQADYRTLWFSPQTHVSYSGYDLLTVNSTSNEYLETKDSDYPWSLYVHPFSRNTWIFNSLKNQNLSIIGNYQYMNVSASLVVIDSITGEMTRCQWDDYNETYDAQVASFFLEPGRTYKLTNIGLNITYISGDYWVNTDTNWTDGTWIVNGTIHVNNTFTVSNSIVKFGNDHYEDNVYNGTTPTFGLIIEPNNSAGLYINDCVFTGMNKAYPYLFKRPRDVINGTNQIVHISNSILASYWGTFWPAGYFTIHQSVIYETQPDNGTSHISLRIETPLYNPDDSYSIVIYNLLIWNYDDFNTIGLFIMPGTIPEPNHIHIEGLTILGGQYGIWFEGSYSNTGLIIYNFTGDYLEKTIQHGSSWGLYYSTFRIDGNSVNVSIEIHTSTMWSWSIKASTLLAKGTVMLVRTDLDNGIYNLIIDGKNYEVAVLNQTLVVGFSGPWHPFKNNFTLIYYGASAISQEGIMSNILWLLILYLPAILMVQKIPKLGFIAGMILMLLVFGFAYPSFLPYMILALATLGIGIYKGVL